MIPAKLACCFHSYPLDGPFQRRRPPPPKAMEEGYGAQEQDRRSWGGGERGGQATEKKLRSCPSQRRRRSADAGQSRTPTRTPASLTTPLYRHANCLSSAGNCLVRGVPSSFRGGGRVFATMAHRDRRVFATMVFATMAHRDPHLSHQRARARAGGGAQRPPPPPEFCAVTFFA